MENWYWADNRHDQSASSYSINPIENNRRHFQCNRFILEKHLPYRIWTQIPFQRYFERNDIQSFKFRLISYNVLSQNMLNAHWYLYEDCVKRNLQWNRRNNRLLRELIRHKAEIICLQEVDEDDYRRHFRIGLKEHGYESIYLKRTGDKTDGCCIFFNRFRLKLIQSKPVPFYVENIPILNRDNCGLVAIFQPIAPDALANDIFCVATTHLLFSPKRGDIKLAQIQYFLAEIDRLVTNNQLPNSYYPLIICGDFNACPQSPLIEFLSTGHIRYSSYRADQISNRPKIVTNQNIDTHQLFSSELLPASFVASDCRFPNSPLSAHSHPQTSGILTHNKQLASVYDLDNFSNVTANIKNNPDCVDYIFFTNSSSKCKGLHLLNRLELYNSDQMDDVHIPNHQFPSDHFILVADFALKLSLHEQKN